LSSGDFATLGMQTVAYIKSVTHEGKAAFAIHSADGKAVAIVADRDRRGDRAAERTGAGNGALTAASGRAGGAQAA
jgi:hypothetical protein